MIGAWQVVASPTDPEMFAVRGVYLVADNLPIEDANLIAAAPALLAALEEIVSDMASDVRKSTLNWGHARDAFDIAQAAIRAARQQEQSHEA